MQIKSILSADRTFAKIQTTSKKRALEAVARVFADSIEAIDFDELLQALITREKLGTTGIGEGIAIPHCRFKTGENTYAACLTLETPIQFDAIDNEPIDLIFAMLVPENAEESHLQTLANLANRFQTTSYAKDLRAAESHEALYSTAIEDY